MSVVKVLSNHYSQDTAFIVDSYPYGSLRCKMRYWLEVHPKKGTRLWSQTTNPKRTNEFDITANKKPKASTYSVVGAMYLDELGHCC